MRWIRDIRDRIPNWQILGSLQNAEKTPFHGFNFLHVAIGVLYLKLKRFQTELNLVRALAIASLSSKDKCAVHVVRACKGVEVLEGLL